MFDGNVLTTATELIVLFFFRENVRFFLDFTDKQVKMRDANPGAPKLHDVLELGMNCRKDASGNNTIMSDQKVVAILCQVMIWPASNVK